MNHQRVSFKETRLEGDRAQEGAALVLTLVIMVILSVVIAGLSRDVRLDLDITRNIQQKDEAFSWAESSLSLTEEVIASLVEVRGTTNASSDVSTTMTFGSSSFDVDSSLKSGETNTWGNRTLMLSESNATLGTTDVEYMGSRQAEGGSIIIAAGYEGVGKGAASGVGVSMYYLISANGTVRSGNGRQQIREVYRYAGR
jgi:Tfp pilus assembly protein PilX